MESHFVNIDLFVKTEEPYLKFRAMEIADLQKHAVANPKAATKIRDELLPKLKEATQQLVDSAKQEGLIDSAKRRGVAEAITNYAVTRMRSWLLLADALEHADRVLIDEHDELWEMCESAVRPPDVGSSGGPGRHSPQEAAIRVAEFHRNLLRLTPRLYAAPGIVLSTLVVFVIMVISGVDFLSPTADSVLAWGANYGPKTLTDQPWRMVSCMFLHFGILHIAFNMWVLWDLSKLVERLVGGTGFIVLYLTTGIAGSMASLIWHPTVVSAGASGAVFGIAGALLGIIVLRRDTVPAIVISQLRNSMVSFVLFNVFLGFSIPGIDQAAHLGGLFVGFLGGLIISQPLSPEMISRRLPRNALTIVALAGVLLLGWLMLPEAPMDILDELTAVGKTEEQVLLTDRMLAVQAQKGLITPEQYANSLESNVLTPWSKARQKVEQIAESESGRKFYVDLARYFKLRETSWRLRIEGVRENDADKIKAADKKWQEAADFVIRQNK